MKQHIRTIVIVPLLILIFPIAILLAGMHLPDLYKDSYYAQLPQLYHRLYETKGNKLVIIGGSNVAFGLDTVLLEDILSECGYNYTICPFGLYAAVGTSAMLELAEDSLSKGDIVILAIEPTSETMSTYFGSTAFWKCCESTPEMLLHLSNEKLNSMVGNYIPYLQERFSMNKNETFPATVGVYAKSSFDASGNMIYERAGNTMALGYDISSPIDLSTVTISSEFANQINDFYLNATEKQAQVFFSFSPMNRSALTNTHALQQYFDLCNDTFSCPIISNPEHYVMDSGWFFDNNFHLNSAGALLRTYTLAEDILAQLGYYKSLEYELPQMPSAIIAAAPNHADDIFFDYTSLGEGFLIAGLTEEGLIQTTLTVPSHKDGYPVVGFTEDALWNGANIHELTLPATIEALPDGLFNNCKNLERLVLQHTERLCAIGTNSFSNASLFRIFVPQKSYPLYRDGDGCEANPWTQYLDRIFTY